MNNFRPLLIAALLPLISPPVVRAEDTSSLPAADFGPVTNTRQMLALLGIDESHFEVFTDGQPYADDESETLIKLLFRMPKFPPTKIHQWTKRGVQPAAIAAVPAEFRRELIDLNGRVKLVTVETPLPEIIERYEIEEFYRCEIDLDGGGQAVVFTRIIPAMWQRGQPIDQRASFDGVFLKIGESGGEGQPPKLYFVAPRVKWHPPTILGNLGMDYGLFDTLTQNKPIPAAEAECFYEALVAAGRAKLTDLMSATRGEKWTVIPASQSDQQLANQLAKLDPARKFFFMGRPEEFIGHPLVFQGRLHRCVPVKITDQELAARLGFSEYYEVAIFIDLDYTLTLVGAEAAKQAGDQKPAGKEVTKYPVFACLREVPAGFPRGQNLNESVRVPGFLFKQWAYRSEFAKAIHPAYREFSPLIVGTNLQWLDRDTTRSSGLGVVIVAAILLVIAAMTFYLWRANRADRAFRREVIARHAERDGAETIEILREPR